ncbi:MAG: hypothetical protein AB3K77_05235 [Methanosarcinaceae archaeon]|uniref:hypothetical protein n=1 Tax=Methanosarcina sp. MTP4 TaxID=1434100 RepID=UPI000A69A328|nr:hypothetical protein [Methanosarcina sp. MTP4]
MPEDADLSGVKNDTNQQTETGQQTSKEESNSISGSSSIYELFGLSGLYLVYRIRRRAVEKL